MFCFPPAAVAAAKSYGAKASLIVGEAVMEYYPGGAGGSLPFRIDLGAVLPSDRFRIGLHPTSEGGTKITLYRVP